MIACTLLVHAGEGIIHAVGPWGPLPGAGGGRPPDFGEIYFNTIRPTPDFGGFCRQNNNLKFYLKRKRKIEKVSQISSYICSKFSQNFQNSKMLYNFSKFFKLFLNIVLTY